MPIARQRQWNCQNQQHALLEYDLVRRACPDGVYLSMTPGNYALWSGVLFVRKGPYAPAIIRFQLAFPLTYPEVPPLVLFTNDVFHPLVTPLTTYTHSTGSTAAGTVSASDEERLLPGSFSLRHGFPSWFERKEVDHEPSSTSRSTPSSEPPKGAGKESESVAKFSFAAGNKPSLFLPPPKDEGDSAGEVAPSIISVLWYMKRVFEDDSLLDELPLEAAGNPGAWNAWQAHRRKIRAAKLGSDGSRSQSGTPKKPLSPPARSQPGTWNWDGVWVERVKRGVSNSLSEAMLFGGVDGDDLIHFLDVEDEAIASFRQPFQSQETNPPSPQLQRAPSFPT